MSLNLVSVFTLSTKALQKQQLHLGIALGDTKQSHANQLGADGFLRIRHAEANEKAFMFSPYLQHMS